jgi:microcystin-dependent protein
MSEPFLAEIRMVGFNFAPRGWALCEGQILPINQNQSLYSLLGTTYGGDGRTTFALPDLRGRVPMHVSDYSREGSRGGSASHTLTTAEMPSHTHAVYASTDSASSSNPTDNVLAQSANIYSPANNTVPMAAGTLTNTGGGQAHYNLQPYCTVNFCIALQGLFPSRN